MDAVAAKQMKFCLLLQKNNFPNRPIKPLARKEVQLSCFLLICTQTPAMPLASETFDQMIRFDLFRFLSGKKCSSICPEKTTENSIEMVSALEDGVGVLYKRC